MTSTLQSKPPNKLSTEEINEFQLAVLEGDEVNPHGLQDRIMLARSIVFLREVKVLAAIAALKSPVPAYRERIAGYAEIKLAEARYPFELGWVFVYPFARNRRYSHVVASEALKQSEGKGVFATARADNVAMHTTLNRLGFEVAGTPYPSRRGGQKLRLFLRKGQDT
ncbi:hypothetical protein ACU6HM_12590 [Alcaligenes sp. RM2]